LWRVSSLLLICATGSSVSQLDASAATWSGRTIGSPGNVSFSWEGVQATFTVSGATQVKLLASSRDPGPACVFHTLIDGNLWLNWTLKATSLSNITIAAGLSPGAHTVVVWYATDPVVPTWDKLPAWSHSFHSFFTDGAFGAPVPKPERRLQIIGDSITVSVDANHPCAPKTPPRKNKPEPEPYTP
jgi:hypothetical protein